MNGRKRFLTGLFAAFRSADESTRRLYADKLARWSLSDDAWSRALSRLVADHQYLPTLAEIYPVLKRAEVQERPGSKSGAWEAWTAPDGKGQRIAHRVNLDQGRPSSAPDAALEYRILVDNPAMYEQCSPAEARAAFRDGWIASGADPAKLPALWPASQAAPHLERLAADYGDPA